MKIFTSLSLLLLPLLSLSVYAQTMNFGTAADENFGSELWDELIDQKLVGPGSIMSRPYEGTDPHGTQLVSLESEISVNGQVGEVIVKRNYGGPGVSMAAVSDNPDDYLMAITVMFKRDGFDAEHNDWFWAKYLPDGSYDKAPNGLSLVGKTAGCIACHGAAPGGDMVYLNDRH